MSNALREATALDTTCSACNARERGVGNHRRKLLQASQAIVSVTQQRHSDRVQLQRRD